jgi:uncharacterized membrane protein YiaA
VSAPTAATGGALARRGLRYLAVLLLLGSGAIHLHDYVADYYRVIPVIGPLFAANFALAIILAVALAVPLERLPRLGPILHLLVALGAMAFAAGVIIGLEISEFSTLFGFHEHGYRFSVSLSLAFEAATLLVLAGYLVLPGTPRTPGRPPCPAPG